VRLAPPFFIERITVQFETGKHAWSEELRNGSLCKWKLKWDKTNVELKGPMIFRRPPKMGKKEVLK
jgi:hypothetical protein